MSERGRDDIQILNRNLWSSHLDTVIVSIVVAHVFLTILGSSINLLLIVRNLTGVLLTLVLPGVLLCRILGTHLDFHIRVPFVVISSIFFAISIGLFLNVVRNWIPYEPYSEGTLTFIYCLAICALLYFSRRFSTSIIRDGSTISIDEVRIITASGIVLAFSILGSYFSRFYSTNLVIVILPVLIILFSFYVLRFDISKEYKIVFLYVVALSLLLQSNLSGAIIGGGDSNLEYYFVEVAINSGFWDPSIQNMKNGVNTIVSLFPVIAVLADIDTMNVFRIIYPITFAVLPVTLYSIYETQFSQHLSYCSALLFCFLHPFFGVLSLNTRTGYSLLFLSFTIWVLLRSRKTLPGRIIQLSSLLLLSSSYYAISPFFLMFLLVILAIYLFDYCLEEILNSRRETQINTSGWEAWVRTTALFLVLTLSWFIYTTQSTLFEKISEFILLSIVPRLQNLTLGAGSAAGNAITQEFSLTFKLIRYEYIVLTILMLVSFIIFSLNRYGWVFGINIFQNSEINSDYFRLGIGSGIVILSALIPTSALGIARLYTVASIMLIPFALYPIQIFLSRYSVERLGTKHLDKVAIVIAILCIFSVNIGLVGLMYGDERVPQEHIIDSQDQNNAFLDYYGSKWAISNTNEQILSSGHYTDRIKRYYFYQRWDGEFPPGSIRPITGDSTGIVYLSSRAINTRTVTKDLYYTTSSIPKSEYLSFSEVGLRDADLIYSNGGSQVRIKSTSALV